MKATNGPRYVVGCRRQIDKTKLKAGTRVALDMTTLTIMRCVVGKEFSSLLLLVSTLTLSSIVLQRKSMKGLAF